MILRARSETGVVVGGILARHKYDVRSRCDPYFLNEDGTCLIASEVKTALTFRERAMWYHKTRGVQVLSALYALNAPTFLLTQKQWKLFVENKHRNSIITFPYNSECEYSAHVKSSLAQPMGTTFLKAIVICLLSKRGYVESDEGISTKDSVPLMQTPEHQIIKQNLFETPQKPARLSDRLQKSYGSSHGRKTPKFISGYVDGKPVYSVVRVLSPELVARIEDEIALQEKASFQKSNHQLSILTQISKGVDDPNLQEKRHVNKLDSQLTLAD